MISNVLWAILVIVLILWLVGWLVVPTGGELIHLLLVVAVILLIYNLLVGSRSRRL